MSSIIHVSFLAEIAVMVDVPAFKDHHSVGPSQTLAVVVTKCRCRDFELLGESLLVCLLGTIPHDAPVVFESLVVEFTQGYEPVGILWVPDIFGKAFGRSGFAFLSWAALA
jgi:hypothetical protein